MFAEKLMLLFALHFAVLMGYGESRKLVGSENCTEPRSEICYLRYDMESEVSGIQGMLNKTACTKSWYCICDATLDIVYYEMPPYIFKDANGTVTGIIPGNTLL